MCRQVGGGKEGGDEDEHHYGGPFLLVEGLPPGLVAARGAHLLAVPHLADDEGVENRGEGQRQDVLGDHQREGADAAEDERHTVVDPDDATGDQALFRTEKKVKS